MLISALEEDLCLAYANTLFWRGRARPTETLHDFSDLLGWLEKSAGVDAASTRESADWSREHSRQAARAFPEAIALRETMYRILAARAGGKPPRRPDLVALQRALAEAPPRHRLVHSNRGYAWQIERSQPSVPLLLAPVLWSAGDLMIKGKHSTLRQCANDKCLWLFLDQSKNATRRWCDMASCGNRAKARRHYLKVKVKGG